jgi:hypothetical protein
MSVHLFGIRHHGVGSARSLLAALESLRPDCILVEGPPEADDLIPLVADEGMEPPIALLVYNPEQPSQSAWYPMAIFSPEWQAIRYGLANGAEVRFCDLPQRYMMALEPEEENAVSETGGGTAVNFAPEFIAYDPLQALAEAAGEPDGERWWSRVVEEARNPAEVFAVIQDAMTALRTEYLQTAPHPMMQQREHLREAWMRKTVRAAEKQYQRIAVVCGAWHTPALAEPVPAKTDDALLKGLPGVKITATFAPWTYSRLSLETGYGAGIASPGWYHHLWETPASSVPSRWLARVAGLLRDEGLLASTAQVIDALRLSEMLAGMRGRSVGLDELNEATIAVLCAGRAEPLNLIRQKLIVGERMGSVPPEVPAVPLQRDIAAWQKRLRLKLAPEQTTLDLDLRQPTDQARSQFFHRLNLLGIPWAQVSRGKVRGKGTFHEFWELQWSPELDIRVIEANVWGNTVESAAVGYASHEAARAEKLSQVTKLLQAVTLAVLPDALEMVVKRLNDLASLTHDVSEQMAGVPHLVDTLRYGDVRQTDSRLIAPVLESMVLRICVGLYGAALGLDDDAAQNLYQRLTTLHSSLQVSQQPMLLDRWYEALAGLMHHDAPHPLLSGTAARLLFRAERASAVEAAQLMRRAFSAGNDPHYATYWLEGFLTGMEHVLLQDSTLFNLVDAWVVGLSGEQFEAVLPLLRRTFATYSAATRRSLSERVKRGAHTVEEEVIDEERGARVLPVMRQILGLV